MDPYSLKDSNIRRTYLLFSVFLIFVIGIGFLFSYIWQSRAILYIAVIFSVFMSVSAYYKSDKIALSISKAKPASKNEYSELYNIVENLCISQGIPVPKIYIIDDISPNAFATGRDPSHSSIAVTTGLLNILDRSEIEGVVAHELSHIKNYDILVASAVVVLVGFLSIISDIFLRSLWFRDRDNRNGGNVLILIGVLFAILSPIVGLLIQLAISRRREYLADASAILMTRYPEGLISALEKISKSPKMRIVNNSTAHLFFAYPSKNDSIIKKTKMGISKLFLTHPPIEDRIKKIKEASF